jgi:hypothetical protein
MWQQALTVPQHQLIQLAHCVLLAYTTMFQEQSLLVFHVPLHQASTVPKARLLLTEFRAHQATSVLRLGLFLLARPVMFQQARFVRMAQLQALASCVLQEAITASQAPSPRAGPVIVLCISTVRLVLRIAPVSRVRLVAIAQIRAQSEHVSLV